MMRKIMTTTIMMKRMKIMMKRSKAETVVTEIPGEIMMKMIRIEEAVVEVPVVTITMMKIMTIRTVEEATEAQERNMMKIDVGVKEEVLGQADVHAEDLAQ